VKLFGEILDLEYGKALKADNRRDGPIPVYGSNGPVGWHDTALVNDAGIVVGRKGNPGTVQWVSTPFFPIDTTFFVSTKSDAPPFSVIYYLLDEAKLLRLSADSGVPGLNRNMVYAQHCVVPPARVARAFDETASKVRALQHALDVESRKLAELGDYLLPKLLSGRVRAGVADVER
jgi:type I restriction enzyme S subunit